METSNQPKQLLYNTPMSSEPDALGLVSLIDARQWPESLPVTLPRQEVAQAEVIARFFFYGERIGATEGLRLVGHLLSLAEESTHIGPTDIRSGNELLSRVETAIADSNLLAVKRIPTNSVIILLVAMLTDTMANVATAAYPLLLNEYLSVRQSYFVRLGAQLVPDVEELQRQYKEKKVALHGMAKGATCMDWAQTFGMKRLELAQMRVLVSFYCLYELVDWFEHPFPICTQDFDEVIDGLRQVHKATKESWRRYCGYSTRPLQLPDAEYINRTEYCFKNQYLGEKPAALIRRIYGSVPNTDYQTLYQQLRVHKSKQFKPMMSKITAEKEPHIGFLTHLSLLGKPEELLPLLENRYATV